MIKKGLLSLGFLAAGLAAQAQIPVFHQEFEAAQAADADKTALGWYEFINLQSSYDEDLQEESADVWSVTGGVLSISNNAADECENQSWQRAIKFRNLNLEEGKSYRLSFKLKGDNVYAGSKKCKATACLMQGVENADVTIGDAINIENITEEGTTYTKMFYFASKEEQDAKYDAACAGKAEYDEANKSKYFLTINVYNPGNFEIDDVVLEESSVQSVEFGGYVVKVNFGYQTNIATIAGADGTGLGHIKNNSAVVKVNGEEVEIECIELKKDGCMYIYTVDQMYDDDKVEVTFTNPGAIHYVGGLASVGEVLNFENEAASFSQELVEGPDKDSHFYAPPKVLSTTPTDGSFALDPSVSEFTFKFDRPVYTAEGLTATMSNGDALTLKEGTPDYAEEVTFVRNGADLAKGLYAITLARGYQSDKGSEGEAYALEFEVGKIQLAKTTYSEPTDYLTQLEEEGGIPTDWTLMLGEVEHAGGSKSRGFIYTNSNVQSALYIRDWEGTPVASRSFEMAEGNAEIRVYTAGWGTSGTFNVKITDAAGNEVANQEVVVSTILEKNRQGNFQIDAIRFQSNGGEYKMTVTLASGNEILFGGFKAYTYTVTEGDKNDAVEVFASKFTGANMPAEGSGWLFYNANNELAPGSGRNGTSGMLERNFHAKMPTAAFFRECGDNADAGHRIVYGMGNGVEDGLELEAGTYEITYYAGTWNDDNGNKNGTSKVFMQLIDANSDAVVLESEHVNVANFENGTKCNGQADKVVEEFKTFGGKYYIKAWGTHNTVWGGLTIVKEGSKAAKYNQMLVDALEEANAELANAESESYNGTTKSALAENIAKYSAENLDMHTPSEYTEAVETLGNLVKAMETRRANIDAYPGSLQGVVNGLEAAKGTKYEALEQFPIVEAAYNNYKDVDYIALEDDALAAAVQAMGDNGTLLDNMVKTCVPLVTKQITDLAKAIILLDGELSQNEYVLAADEAITDDQTLVDNLKTVFAAKLYKQIAEGENPFAAEIDEDTLDEIPTEIDATAFIQNAQFYCTQPVIMNNVNTAPENYPGWDITVNQGQITSVFTTAWDGPYPTELKPIENCAVKTGWGTANYDVKQLIGKLPVAIYTASIKIGEDGNADNEGHGCYAFCQDEQQAYEGTYNSEKGEIEYTRDNNKEGNLKTFKDITPDVDGNFASLTLGAHMQFNAGFGNVDNATLLMTGKVEGFDYAAAAAALEENATAIQSVKIPAGEPVNVKYYDLNGVQTNAPKGVCIKIETYKNGTTVVKKAIK